MGAPRGPRTGNPKQAIAVRLPGEVIAWLDSEADRLGLTRSGAAARAIERVHQRLTQPRRTT